MKEVLPLNHIDNFQNIAYDLRSLLLDHNNNDIAKEFPSTVASYTVDTDQVAINLETAKKQYKIGRREQFIIMFGEQAIGMSIVTNDIDTPVGVDPLSPNLSGFICNPYRNLGLGRLSLETRMQIVKNNFNDNAWTLVKKQNNASEHLVTSVGFTKSITVNDDRDLYLYNSQLDVNK